MAPAVASRPRGVFGPEVTGTGYHFVPARCLIPRLPPNRSRGEHQRLGRCTSRYLCSTNNAGRDSTFDTKTRLALRLRPPAVDSLMRDPMNVAPG